MKTTKTDCLQIVQDLNRTVKEGLRLNYPDQIRSVPYSVKFTDYIEETYYDTEQAIELISEKTFYSAFFIKLGQMASLIKYEMKIVEDTYYLHIKQPYENYSIAVKENFIEHFSNELALMTSVLRFEPTSY